MNGGWIDGGAPACCLTCLRYEVSPKKSMDQIRFDCVEMATVYLYHIHQLLPPILPVRLLTFHPQLLPELHPVLNLPEQLSVNHR